MSRRLVIIAYYGPYPDWIEAYLERAQGRDFDWLVHTDLADFHARVRKTFGIESCPVMEGGTKIHDYRAVFGRLFAPELVYYDWWAHTDLDCVYGDLGRFWNDELIDDYDVVSDHGSYLCGPWAMYRNHSQITDVFSEVPDWEAILRTPKTTGWVENSLTAAMNEIVGDRVLYRQLHEYGDPEPLWADGDRLFYRDREIPMFHFRRTKAWPLWS